MRCFDWPRNRSISCTRSPAYHTAIVSAPTHASTTSPIRRAGTEYTLAFTRIVLPRLTRTRRRSNASRRRPGNARNRDNSSATASRRPPFRCASTARTNPQYASRLAKSRLPRNNNACSNASLKRRWLCSQSPFS